MFKLFSALVTSVLHKVALVITLKWVSLKIIILFKRLSSFKLNSKLELSFILSLNTTLS